MEGDTSTHVKESKVHMHVIRLRIGCHAETSKILEAANPNPNLIHATRKRNRGQSESKEEEEPQANGSKLVRRVKRTPKKKHSFAPPAPSSSSSSDGNSSEEEAEKRNLYREETCTPSYLFLREREPLRDGESEILNRQCRLVPPPYESKHVKKSESEVARLLLDDDRYELDMYHHRLQSALNYAKQLNSHQTPPYNDAENPTSSDNIQEYTTARDRKNIATVFQDNGKTILNKLESYPAYIAPIIIARLSKMIEDCKQAVFTPPPKK